MSKTIVVADEHGNIIVRRTLKEGENPTDTFKQIEEEYFKKQTNGN